MAWKLKSTEGYRLSKPISAKITDLLHIDDLKVFAASESKLATALKSSLDVGMEWNEKKCSVTHIKRSALDQSTGDVKVEETAVIAKLKTGEHYKFLGVLENLKQEDKLVLKCATEVYLQRMSVIRSSPLSDYNRVHASNQFALPVLTYYMRTQQWPIAELQQIDRETRKIIVENGGKHLLGSKSLLYLPREDGGRGLKSVEKLAKIKAAVNLCQNTNPTMELVRSFEEASGQSGHHSLLKDAIKYAKELHLDLKLGEGEPTCRTVDGKETEGRKIGTYAKEFQQKQLRKETEEEKW